MKRAAIAGAAIAIVLIVVVLLVVFVVVNRARKEAPDTVAATPSITPSTTPAAADTLPAPETYQGFLYGRVTTVVGTIYEGRLRFGETQEAFWGDYFNGAKKTNPWAAEVPPQRLPKESRPLVIFGFLIAERERPMDLGRLFMARFADIVRIDVQGRNVRVTLKSGTAFDLDRFEAGDIDDGVRVWDNNGSVVDLDSLQIRTIELLPTPSLSTIPARLYGTVRTPRGDFTGFVQWDREECAGTDELDGRTAEGKISLRFDTIRSIARRSPEGVLVTLLDGREIGLGGTNDVGKGNRGIYVDDLRYGRVLISWDAFERVDFSPAGSGPAFEAFPPGSPITGSVTTRAGVRLTGRLVYDLDESEITETLDAPSQGVDYTIPFGLVTSIALPSGEENSDPYALVTLDSGEELQLEIAGDLGEKNAGMLIFVEGREHPEYVPWSEVAKVVVDRPAVMYPPRGDR